MSIQQTVLFAVAIAFLRLAYGGYTYGLFDAIDHQPLIERALDPGYLVRDFRVNAGAAFDPRTYYTAVMAFLGRVAPLPAVSAVLTFLLYAAVAYFTARTAMVLFESRLAALAAGVLVLSVDPFYGMDYLVASYLKPSFVSRAFGYGALLAGLQRRPIAAAALSAVSSFFHPTLAIETAAFALSIAAVVPRPPDRASGDARGFAVAGLILAAHTLLFWWLPYGLSLRSFRMDDALFLRIALFRTEYTTVPSSFPLRFWIGGAVFLAALTAVWAHWFHAATEKGRPRAVGLCVAGILAFCLGGYLFVELLPLRAWVAARAFRMMFVVKWLGLLVIVGVPARSRRWTLFAAANAGILVWAAVAGEIQIPALVLATLLAALVAAVPAIQATRAVRPAWLTPVLPLLVVAAAAVDQVLPSGWIPGAARARPMYDLPAADPIARYAAARTPADAVFLTPYDYGLFRLTARRAIVVDWRSMPFDDAGMLEWWRRMNACYGDVGDLDREVGLRRMDQAYHSITDARLRELSVAYGAGYAVLYAETKTSHAVLERTETHKLVALTD